MIKRHILVVNMIPKSMSGEKNQDSEPQVTVDPENTRTLLGTAFTPDPAGGPDGPIYESLDGSHRWTLNLVISGANSFIDTFDQSIRFGSSSTLYAGVLNATTGALNILRSAPYSSTNVMGLLVQRPAIDQPYVTVKHSQGRDRVFIGNNDISSGVWQGSVEHSPNAENLPPPGGFNQSALDTRVPHIRELPSIRCAAHSDGTTYVAYIRVVQSAPQTLCDVIVARDDNFATGAPPFIALVDPFDGHFGIRVRRSVPFPWTWPFTFLGLERVGSALSIAVDPRDRDIVYLAWGEGPLLGSIQTVTVCRSTDRGLHWSGNLLEVPNSTNPALAIAENGKVGILYQQFIAGSAGNQRWQTHIQFTHDAWNTSPEDILVADTVEDPATHTFDPHLGDYADLQAHGNDFYGIFSANNYPDLGNFPHGVHYQRNADFSSHRLFDVNGTTLVTNSIDPFSVIISWHEEPEEKVGRLEEIREHLIIKGLKYEKWEIDELKVDFEGFGGSEQEGFLLKQIGNALIRLGERANSEDHDKST